MSHGSTRTTPTSFAVRETVGVVGNTVNGDAVRDGTEAGAGRTEQTRANIAALGVDINRLAKTYPVEVWAACVKLIAADVFAGVDEIEAQRRLGNRRIDVAARSLKGRVLFALSRRLPPQRALAKYVAGLRAGASYIDTRCDVLGANHYRVWVNDVSDMPGFFMGMIEGGARHATRRTDPIRIESRDGASCTYVIGSP